MKNHDELIKQVAIIIGGIALIFLINWLSGVFSAPPQEPPPPPEFNTETFPSPEEFLSR